MFNLTPKNRFVLVLALIIGLTTACKKDDGDGTPAPSTPTFRVTKIDYNSLTPTTSYKAPFLLANGDSTIDRTDGRNRLRMFRALATYISSSITAGTAIDETKLNNMYANIGSPFDAPYADLNDVDMSIKEATAASKSNQLAVHTYLQGAFANMAEISTQASQTAVKGTAGKLGTYLVDEDGVEWNQIIQKGLIGAFQLDYIGNVLLNTGLDADNSRLIPGKKYTQLEHNWDEAYGFLTFNDMYFMGVIDETAPKPTGVNSEYYLGSYAWEYNKPGFVKLHGAFLKGRAAIHNNDMVTVRAQAAIIRDVLEKAIAGAAEGYMYKSGVATSTEASRAHAFGEGLGFVYSTRFCTLSGADNAFSNGVYNGLINATTPTFYDIAVAQYTTARTAITTKFGIVVVH